MNNNNVGPYKFTFDFNKHNVSAKILLKHKCFYELFSKVMH